MDKFFSASFYFIDWVAGSNNRFRINQTVWISIPSGSGTDPAEEKTNA